MENKSSNNNLNLTPHNDVALLSRNPSNARIIAAANTMLAQARTINVTLYIFAWIPLIASFIIPYFADAKYSYICSFISLFISILTQVLSTSMNSHKERAVLVTQLYEANITSTTLARIEYDRESTNEANEYALRKGNRFNMEKLKSYYQVPLSLPNKYCYLYTQRIKVSEDRYMLGKNRIFLAAMMFIIGIGISAVIVLLNTVFKPKDFSNFETILPLIISLYPVLVPVITSFTEAAASNKRAIKIAADIDNYFADHDKSMARLERFNYYIQALMYEYRVKLKPIPLIIKKLAARKLKVVRLGCTERFMQSTMELEGNKNVGKMLNGSYNKVYFTTVQNTNDNSKKANEGELIDLVLQKKTAASIKKEFNINNSKKKNVPKNSDKAKKELDQKKKDSSKKKTTNNNKDTKKTKK